jgi:primosomal protein N' (replication factor Y)
MREEYAARAGRDLSRPLRDGDRGRLERREQAIVLLNRAGSRPRVLPAVRRDARVPELQRLADGAQGGAARAVPLLQLRDAVPKACVNARAVSRAARIRHRAGRGRDRERFPGARRRVDRDTIRAAARSRAAAAFRAGEIDVLVGTQMIAKGHDFPAVTLVGVISADVGSAWPTSAPRSGRSSC